jgi:hypothetical protein
VPGVGLLGDGDVAVDVDGTAGCEGLRTEQSTVRVQHHAISEHPEVDLVPVLVEYLRWTISELMINTVDGFW